MSDQPLPLAALVNTEDTDAVVDEIKATVRLPFPGFDFEAFDRALKDVVILFRGDYPGYRECNSSFHNLHHTMIVTLAVARLMHGAMEAGHPLSEKHVNMGLISGLMHDTGYIQRHDDREGTGAKYTMVHIGRSAAFVRDYYRKDPLFRDDIDSFRSILFCTGYSINIGDLEFPDDKVEMLGKILGTGDLLGQMADRLYLEKLPDLYNEFLEGGITMFTSPLDLLEKTRGFYTMTLKRFSGELGNVHLFSRDHFRARWGLDEDLYAKATEKNIAYLDYVVTNHRDDYRRFLRRSVSPLPGA